MKNLVTNLLLVLLPFLLLEAVFRLLPVSSPPYILPVNADNPVARMQPDRDYVFSSGWDFSIIADKRTNNYGYNNLQDYRPADAGPLLAVIGDSYVEAFQVDAGRTAAEILADTGAGRLRVYSAGLSGAPLSQYLVFAGFFRKEFSPDAMMFVVVGNDFDESLLRYKSDPRFHYFAETASGLELRRVDYHLSALKRVLRKSALIRYLMLNLKVKAALEGWKYRQGEAQSRFAGNTLAEAGAERLAYSRRAVDAFLEQLPARSGLPPERMLFVLDGIRPQLYSAQDLSDTSESYFAHMRAYFMQQACAAGYEVIDMQPVFASDYLNNGQRFEFAIDGHWNETGHALVAGQVRESRVFRSLSGAEPLPAASGSRTTACTSAG